jgi:uncharacterized protein (TIGR02145 family)
MKSTHYQWANTPGCLILPIPGGNFTVEETEMRKPMIELAASRLLLIFLSGFLLISCEKNYPPRIVITEYTRQPGIGTTTFNLRVEATDAEMDPLTFLWESAQGTFVKDAGKAETSWTAPVSTSDQSYRIWVRVSDGNSEVSDTLEIPVAAVTFGKLSGIVYFTGTKVPVSDAIVTVDGKRDTASYEGVFEIDGVRSGRQTITAQKAEFISGSIDVLIRQGTNSATLFITSPLNTCRVYGQITGNRTNEPKPYHTVIILNPDNTESELLSIANGTGNYSIAGIPKGLRRLVVKDDIRVRMETLIYFEGGDKEFNFAIPEPFQFTDTRDQHVYQAVKVSSLTWMAENLAYLPSVAPAFTQGGVWVYGYSGFDVDAARASENYKKYGVLYDWPTAMADTHGNGRDICPPGWHLPDDGEWKALELALGMDPTELDSVAWRFTGEVGKKLKYESGWDNNGNGSNTSGFSALPAGYRTSTGIFIGLYSHTNFWSSTSYNDETIWRRQLDQNHLAIWRYNEFPTNGFSVRCVKDR